MSAILRVGPQAPLYLMERKVAKHLATASDVERRDFWQRMTAVFRAGPTLTGCTGFAKTLDRIETDQGIVQILAVMSLGHVGIVMAIEGEGGPFVVIAAINTQRVLRRKQPNKNCVVIQESVLINGDAFRIDCFVDPGNFVRVTRLLDCTDCAGARMKIVSLDLRRAHDVHLELAGMVM